MSLGLWIPPLVWLLVCGSLMWGLDRLAPLATMIEAPADRGGWLLVALGAAVAATAVRQFRRARTTVDPRAPAKATALVQSGIFGYSRNPMYLGMALVLCGWAVILGTAGPWLGVPLFVFLLTRVQIEPEEAVLSTLFGAEFTAYCARVGRWLGRSR
jgi:protein-S-isoprenylcysteine O-methyltransferase Ste14